ncbi:RpiB/LacA/LacB family sugar-phosphate isomerase [Patescibacteria group bacterium]|nr:RpiB/LacA/LacB family sugar-phosphate isomerase [Patescibacteria group bacterium]
MIFLGADHGGFELKNKVKKWLEEWEEEYQDLGNKEYDQEDDYPDFAVAVAKEVAKGGNRGILFCRSAAGMVITANKIADVRAVAAFDQASARHSREHNDANILVLSGDWLDDEKAQTIVETWLNTKFTQEERHVRRLNKIKEIE